MSELMPVLTVIDGVPTTTSQDVARHFGKKHFHVMRDIRELLKQIADGYESKNGFIPPSGDSPEGYERNFALIQIETDLGMGRFRKDPAYRLTKDGFTLLAMGFTGAQALKFKLAYIDAFNKMESTLHAQSLEAAAQPGQFERAARSPRIPAHEADRIVAASRTFNAMLRSSQAARIPLPTALRLAGEVALRETGIDMLVELRAESHLADLDAKAAARTRASTVPDWADDAPDSPAHFWHVWSSGQLEVPFQSCTSAQAYQAYARWCQLTGQAFTVRHGHFSQILQRAAAESGSPVFIKPMRLGEVGDFRIERMLLISRPPEESQGAWATALARQFEIHLRVFLAKKRNS